MSVLELKFYHHTEPTTLLATLTEDDILGFEMRQVMRGIGSGLVVLDRRTVDPVLYADRTIVKVVLPQVSGSPQFAFRVESAVAALLNRDDDQSIAFGGGSLLSILRDAVLPIFPDGYPTTKRGSSTLQDIWWWKDQAPGAIATRMIEEGQDMDGEPLQHVTMTFDRNTDTSSVPWGATLDEYEAPIGANLYEALQGLEDAGDFLLRMQTGLVLDAYQTFGTARTSTTFAAGKVRLTPDNMLTDLERSMHGRTAWTHVITRNSSGSYGLHVSPDYVAGEPARYGYLDVSHTNDHTKVVNTAQYTMLHQREGLDTVEVEIAPGDDELNGRYLPFKHIDVGDRITLHTGTDDWDYNNKALRVTGMRVSLGIADDTNADTQAASLQVVLELNGVRLPGGGRSSGGGSAGSGTASGGGGGSVSVKAPPVPKACIPDVLLDGDAEYGMADIDDNQLGTTILLTLNIPDTGSAIAVFVEQAAGDPAPSTVEWRPTAGSGTGAQAMTARATALTNPGAGNLRSYTLDNPTPGNGGGGAGQVRIVVTSEASAGAEVIHQTTGFIDDGSNTATGTGPTSVTPDSEPGGHIATGISSANAGDSTLTTGTDVLQHTSSGGDPQGLEIGHQAADAVAASTTVTWTHATGSRGMIALSFGSGSVTLLKDGHADLVGEGTRWSRCGHAHHVFRDVAPAGETRDDGYFDGTLWVQLDDLVTPTAIVGRWLLVDQTAGTWVDVAGGGGTLEVAEADGTPDVSPVTRIEFDGATVTDLGGGVVEVAITPGGALALDGLTDVDTTGQADGDFLQRASGIWVPIGSIPANKVSIADAGGYFTGTDVEAALQELGAGGGGGGSFPVPWVIPGDTGVHIERVVNIGANNRGIYLGVTIPVACTITGVIVFVGASNGTISAALCDSVGTRLATSGSVACPGGSAVSTILFTAAYAAAAGRYLIAFSSSTTTASFGIDPATGFAPLVSARYEANSHPIPVGPPAAFDGVTSNAPVLALAVQGGHP